MPPTKSSGEIPVGRLLSRHGAAEYLDCSDRQVDVFAEQGRLRFFRMGKLKKTTQPECDWLIAQLIQEEAARLGELADK